MGLNYFCLIRMLTHPGSVDLEQVKYLLPNTVQNHTIDLQTSCVSCFCSRLQGRNKSSWVKVPDQEALWACISESLFLAMVGIKHFCILRLCIKRKKNQASLEFCSLLTEFCYLCSFLSLYNFCKQEKVERESSISLMQNEEIESHHLFWYY